MKLFRKDKKLSAYELACGYVEVYRTKEIIPMHVVISDPPFFTERAKGEIKLWKEHNCYHVTVFNGKPVSHEGFSTLDEARKWVSVQRKELQEV